MSGKEGGLSYRQAGVDIDAGNRLVDLIKPFVRATRRPGADAEIGGFGGVFDLKALGMRDPLLVASNDGVGTKVKLAIDANRHEVGKEDPLIQKWALAPFAVLAAPFGWAADLARGEEVRERLSSGIAQHLSVTVQAYRVGTSQPILERQATGKGKAGKTKKNTGTAKAVKGKGKKTAKKKTGKAMSASPKLVSRRRLKS